MRPFLLWIICLGLRPGIAQDPAYLQYTVREGLPSNLVYSCLQDARGLLWFGTDKGLTCFDGQHFYTYNMANGLPDPEVLQVKEDKSGRLWVFCFQKNPCYIKNGRVYTEADDSLLAKLNFTSGTNTIWEDPQGGIWHVEPFRPGYYSYDGKLSVHKFPGSLWSLQQVGEDFLAFCGQSILRIGPHQEIQPICTFSPEKGPASVAVSGNRIVYSYHDKNLLFEYRDGQVKELATSTYPTGQAFTDRSGRFWICSATLGAICFDNPQHDLSNPVFFLPGKKVTAMHEDRQGTLWFSTIEEGVFALPRNSPLTYSAEEFPFRNIRSLSHSDDGRLLIGDNLGNVHILTNDRVQSVALTPTQRYNQIRQIIPASPGAFWAAADDDLYLCTDHFTKVQHFGNDYSLKSALIQDHKIWYAASTRLGYTDMITLNKKAVALRRFTKIEQDSAGNIWAGGINGLYSQRDSFQYNWGDRFPSLKGKIIEIKNNGGSQLYVVTPKDGLLEVRIDSGTVLDVKKVNDRLEQPIDNIQSVFVASTGNVWMATNRGVYGLQPDGRRLHFDTYDGLANDDVNTVLVDKDTLWAGTVSGLTRINLRLPDQDGNFATYITDLRYQVKVRSTWLHLLDSVVSEHKIRLPVDAAAIELDLTGLDFRSRGNLQFEILQSEELPPLPWWTLDNLIQWIARQSVAHQDTIRTGSYVFKLGSYLPSGQYRIQVTALKGFGIRSQYPDTWTLLKPPHWYEILWIYILLFGLVLYSIIRIYKARLDFQQVRASTSVLQLQVLQAQINPHFIGNAINAIQQFLHPPDPIKASEYIALFMRLLRQTMHFSAEAFISFDEELTYINQYLQLMVLRFEDSFTYQITGAESIPKSTMIPSMLLQPVLENATIHGVAPSGQSVIQLRFSFEQGKFCCELTDNGIGYQETQRRKQLAGVTRVAKGLSLLKQKIDSLNALYGLDMDFSIQDLAATGNHQRGTRVILSYYPKTHGKK